MVVGYIGGGYRGLIPETHRIMVSRDVRLMEHTMKWYFTKQKVSLDDSETIHTFNKQVDPPPVNYTKIWRQIHRISYTLSDTTRLNASPPERLKNRIVMNS